MSKYEKIMEEITISDSSRERILDQIVKEAEDGHKRKKSRNWFSRYAAAAAGLAVLLIGTVFVFNRSNYNRDLMIDEDLKIEDISGIEEIAEADAIPDKEEMAEANAIPDEEEMAEADARSDKEDTAEDAASLIECRSAAQLSKQVGFEIRDIDSLRAASKEVHYYAYGKELAEIIYTTEQGEACYRISSAAEHGTGGDDTKEDNDVIDNSGHENEYTEVEKVSAGESNVILKGEGNLYYLGIWQSGAYSYSLYMPEGMNREEWVNILKFQGVLTLDAEVIH